jgi:hypothetical protein
MFAVVLALIGHTPEPFLKEQMGHAIHLRGGTQSAGSQLGRGLALHQGHDDLAAEATHGDARPDALVANNPPLAFSELLPNQHHLGTNRHEEFLALACWRHDVSGWNYSFT